MQKTMLRVWYKHSVGVHWGNFVPAHFCGLYTRNVGISLLVQPNGLPTPQKADGQRFRYPRFLYVAVG